MQPKDAFDELRKAKEEEYFLRRESELLEKLRLRAAGEAGRRELGEALETTYRPADSGGSAGSGLQCRDRQTPVHRSPDLRCLGRRFGDAAGKIAHP